MTPEQAKAVEIAQALESIDGVTFAATYRCLGTIADTLSRALRGAEEAGRVVTDWRTDMENAPEYEIHNVVGRYPHATAGFPRYAAKVNGKWQEYSRHEPEELVVWAWRPRGEWPQCTQAGEG